MFSVLRTNWDSTVVIACRGRAACTGGAINVMLFPILFIVRCGIQCASSSRLKTHTTITQDNDLAQQEFNSINYYFSLCFFSILFIIIIMITTVHFNYSSL